MTARHRGRLIGAYHVLPKNGGQWEDSDQWLVVTEI